MSAAAYVASSLAMTSLTKYAASAWRFPGSSLLLLIECWATVLALAHKGFKFTGPVLRHLPLVTLTKAVNMYLSFLAMKRTSLPVYNVLKRLQPVYAMIQDRLVRQSSPSEGEFAGVVLISLGTIITGLGDLDFDLKGYGLALMAAACQSLYLVLARHAQDKAALSSMDLVFYTACYNSVLFIPLTLLELPDVRLFLSKDGEMANFWQFLLPYVTLGAVLNYTTFWCTSVNNPLGHCSGRHSQGAALLGCWPHLRCKADARGLARLDRQHLGRLSLFMGACEEGQEGMKSRAEASKGLIRATSAPSLKAAAACNFRHSSWRSGEVA